MSVKIYYDDFRTEDNKQIISKIEADLENHIKMELSVNHDCKDTNVATVKLVDSIGVDELESTISKKDLREMIDLFKQIFKQLD